MCYNNYLSLISNNPKQTNKLEHGLQLHSDSKAVNKCQIIAIILNIMLEGIQIKTTAAMCC